VGGDLRPVVTEDHLCAAEQSAIEPGLALLDPANIDSVIQSCNSLSILATTRKKGSSVNPS
jgi:hypothetical protein